MKIVRKVLFWIITVLVVMFIGCMALATGSRIHIGEKFGDALLGGFCDTADGIGQIIGLSGTKVDPDVVINFKNGEIGFGNTHISW